ncbi:cation:proton antiporter [Algoriphagus jejuensis]|uniref:Cation:proton antiporter n=1 Tax=Algoriphagus jejuensis TaxID=419934 RepID=A0ABP3YJE0_9BACT
MDPYILVITLIGLATFTMAWMPTISKRTRISYSVFYLVGGFLIYFFFSESLPSPLPQQNQTLTLHLAELIVIISLMGAGLKIERPFSFAAWTAPIRLLTVAMLLCIAIAALFGYFLLGLGLASSVLLGAVLAPTDPVLAADVQVGPPNDKKTSSETQFSLTAEAGMNDGMAFPFTWLAITLGLMSVGEGGGLSHWFSFHLLYRIGMGVAIGGVLGYGIAYLVFDLAKKHRFLHTRDGFLAIASTLLVYGVTEAAHGYGFIAVFVCAVVLRSYERNHRYHDHMHSFTDQIERLLVALLLILFGGALYSGILQALDWKMVGFVLAFLFVIRPLAAYLSLIGSGIHPQEKLAISFFGIRGMGSLFYLAFALEEFDFASSEELWAMVSLTVALSILLHGFTASRVVRRVRRSHPSRES